MGKVKYMKSYYEIADLDFDEFLKENSFEDNTGAYNCELIKVNDIKSFWEHHRSDIGSNISNIYDCLSMITRNIEDIEDMII